MCKRILAAALIACFWTAQLPVVSAQSAAGTPAPSTQITVPAGTVIPLNLVTSIRKKSTQPGDTIRASVAFPVVVNGRVAIPAGSYVEGTLRQSAVLDRRGRTTAEPQIHFNRLLFANGYSVALDGVNTEVSQQTESSPAQALALTLPVLPAAFFGGAQTTMPTMPSVGPDKGTVVGVMVGVFVAFAVMLALIAHHAGKAGAQSDNIVHDAGWQFQLALSTPLTLDAAQVAAASRLPVKN